MREKTIKTETVFQGKLLKLEVLTVELESGMRVTREIVRHRGAAAVLGRLPDGRFALVRQFRKPIEKYLLEAVAGGLEAGESPEQCAVREIGEETGYSVRALRPLGRLIPTPGYCDENIHLFLADLGEDKATHAADADEHLTVVLLTATEIERMVAAGEIEDAKTLALWLKAGGAAIAGHS